MSPACKHWEELRVKVKPQRGGTGFVLFHGNLLIKKVMRA